MAVFTGIRVYGCLKPTLTCSLVTGGSLLPNTKYYVFGVMRTYLVGIYNPTYGEVSNITEITTTSNEKSIQINHKTFRNITSCIDGGSGKVKITAIKHCLKTSDIIKISNGIYAGTYTVIDIDYDNFYITSTYAGDYVGTFYTDSDTYNNSKGMVYWISQNNPIDSDGNFNPNRYSQYTLYDWDSPAINNTIVTIQPIKMLYSSGSPDMQGMGTGIYSGLKTTGTISILVTATKTLKEIKDEINLSGFGGCWNYATNPKTNTLTLAGSIKFSNGATFNLYGIHIINICGEIVTAGDKNSMTWTNCTITLYGAPYQNFSNPYLIGGGYTVAGFSPNNQAYIILGSPASSSLDTYGQGGQGDFNEVNPNGTKAVYINKNYWSYKPSYLYVVYAQAIFRNINATNTYLYFLAEYTPLRVDDGRTFYYDNIVLKDRPLTYDVNWYDYLNGGNRNHIISCRNVDILAYKNNIKKVYRAAYNSVLFNWYRNVNLLITDNLNTAINNASINIIDKNGTTYNFITTNGNATVEVIEQTSTASVNDATRYSTDDTKNPYTITVSKVGYETHKEILNTVNIKNWQITLKQILQMRYDAEGNIYKAITPELGSSAKIIKI